MAKLPLPSWWPCTIAGNSIDLGSATVRSPRPLTVATRFALETDVEVGAGGHVTSVDGVVGVVEWLEPAHAPAKATDAVSSAARVPAPRVSGRSRV
jgi:hypothetical protein